MGFIRLNWLKATERCADDRCHSTITTRKNPTVRLEKSLNEARISCSHRDKIGSGPVYPHIVEKNYATCGETVTHSRHKTVAVAGCGFSAAGHRKQPSQTVGAFCPSARHTRKIRRSNDRGANTSSTPLISIAAMLLAIRSYHSGSCSSVQTLIPRRPANKPRRIVVRPLPHSSTGSASRCRSSDDFFQILRVSAIAFVAPTRPQSVAASGGLAIRPGGKDAICNRVR